MIHDNLFAKPKSPNMIGCLERSKSALQGPKNILFVPGNIWGLKYSLFFEQSLFGMNDVTLRELINVTKNVTLLPWSEIFIRGKKILRKILQ